MNYLARQQAVYSNLARGLLLGMLMFFQFVPYTATGQEKSTYEWVQVTDSAAWRPRFIHSAVVHSDGIWVIGGSYYTESVPFTEVYQDAWWSETGTDWLEAPGTFPGRGGHASVSYGGALWALGGTAPSLFDPVNDVWYSNDGATWTEATAGAAWQARALHASVVHDGKMWVLGGLNMIFTGMNNTATNFNDVWWSTDGVTWTQSSSDAQWSGRYGHTSLVFNNKLWLLGGATIEVDGFNINTNRHNDVWSSEDGVTWTQAVANAPWSPRNSHTSVVFEDKMWVVGGAANDYFNDAWFSEDGINWTQANTTGDWPGSYAHASVVFDNKVWVLGGDRITEDVAEVWHLSRTSVQEGEGEGEQELGWEADVAPRTEGDGQLLVNDWVQVGRFVAGLDTPVLGSEFQRADCAPLSTFGDGQLLVNDWVQAGRFVAGLDAPQLQAGPIEEAKAGLK